MRSRNLISWMRGTVLNYKSVPITRGDRVGRTNTVIEWHEMQGRLQMLADLSRIQSAMRNRRYGCG